jgi:hypothetical protein
MKQQEFVQSVAHKTSETRTSSNFQSKSNLFFL